MRDNARIMSLDKANSKLLVEIKKLHCPDVDAYPAPSADLPANINELDLVNGGDDIGPEPKATTAAAASDPTPAEPSGEPDGPGYDLC